MVYESDVDACGLGTAPLEDTFVPLFEAATANRTRQWRPWALGAGDSVLGGYAIEWAGGRARFASVRGAGHMAPLNRPHAAYKLMNAFTGAVGGLPPMPRPRSGPTVS